MPRVNRQAKRGPQPAHKTRPHVRVSSEAPSLESIRQILKDHVWRTGIPDEVEEALWTFTCRDREPDSYDVTEGPDRLEHEVVGANHVRLDATGHWQQYIDCCVRGELFDLPRLVGPDRVQSVRYVIEQYERILADLDCPRKVERQIQEAGPALRVIVKWLRQDIQRRLQTLNARLEQLGQAQMQKAAATHSKQEPGGRVASTRMRRKEPPLLPWVDRNMLVGPCSIGRFRKLLGRSEKTLYRRMALCNDPQTTCHPRAIWWERVDDELCHFHVHDHDKQRKLHEHWLRNPCPRAWRRAPDDRKQDKFFVLTFPDLS